MPNQYVSITRKDLSRGIDALSPKGSVQDGYATDLQNVTTLLSGDLQTRTGYEGYYGWVPMRVKSIAQAGTQITLEFNSAQVIDLAQQDIGPVVVYGKLGAPSGAMSDFSPSTNAGVWYPKYTLGALQPLALGSGTLTQASGLHGFSDVDFWAGLAQDAEFQDLSNFLVLPDDVRIDTSTYSLDLDYTTAEAGNGYVYYRDATDAAGLAYTDTSITSTQIAISATSPGTDEITVVGHGLEVGDALTLFGAGTLPAPLLPATVYWVAAKVDDDLKLAATKGGAVIDLTAAHVGVVTAQRASFSVPTATHQLNTFNILAKVWDTTTVAGKRVELLPQDVWIDTSGNVTVFVVYDADWSGAVSLQATSEARKVTGTATVVGGGPTLNTIVISDPGSPFVFISGYRFNGADSRFESVLIEDVRYDVDADTLTVDYLISGDSAEAVELYWLTGSVISNTILLEAADLASHTESDAAPQLTVWGLDHASAYRSDLRGGWVTHLDSYRRVAEQRLVCGLGGNLFKAVGAAEATAALQYGSALANYRNRVDVDTNMAPVFHAAPLSATYRTRGTVVDTSVTNNRARVGAAAWVSGNLVDYTLSFTGKTGTFATAVTPGFDRLTVDNMANPEHTGTWVIASIESETATEVVVRVTNPGIADAGRDEAGADGGAGVFSDTFVAETTVNWLPGDRVVGDSVADDLELRIISVSGATIYVSGVVSQVQMPDGQRIGVRRTSALVPLRLSGGSASTTGFVQGDMLAVTSLVRRPRALAVRGLADDTVDITGDGITATATSAGSVEHGLNSGDRVVLFDGPGSGEYTVIATPSLFSFTFASPLTSGSLTLQGHVVQVDEVIDTEDSADATALSVDGRWQPIEAPATLGDLPATTHYLHLDASAYDAQPSLRSTIIQDSMFFVNGVDEVFKFDGTHLTRAGLPSWQPTFAMQSDAGAAPSISIGQEVTITGLSGTDMRYFETDASVFKSGDRLYHAASEELYTVSSVAADSSQSNSSVLYRNYVSPEDDFDALTATTVQLVRRYRYYARLNLIDRNQLLVASYAAGPDDLVVDYVQRGQIQLKLLAPPVFGPLDYDRIELELYRTTGNGEGPYYLQSRQLVAFNRASPYILVSDARQDSAIAVDDNLDLTMSALIGADRLGQTWEAPPRASTITTLNNRLLLGNLKGYPELAISLAPASTAADLTAANLAGSRWLFRRDPTDTGTSSNVVDRIAYEFVTAGETTFDPTAAARDATSFTIPTGSPPAVGSWVYIFHDAGGANNSLQLAGWWQVASVVAATSFTVTHNNTFTLSANDCNRYVTASTSTDMPVWLGEDGNLNQREGNAAGTDVSLQAGYRLSVAINASMRATTDSVVPWLAAKGGGTYAAGRLIVSSPLVLTTVPSLQLPASLAEFRTFVGGISRAAADQVGFETAVFPSRLARSYRNYPTLFDNVFTANPDESDSVIDVNPSDGQAIVSIIPFFGESATSEVGNVLSQNLVVVKEQSVYLVNVERREVQKIDSRGLGGSAIAAVANTQRGIVFVNASGVFRLNRDMSISHIGRMLTRIWRSRVTQAALANVHAHHYAIGRQIKLSVPVDGATTPSEVLVYDYEREDKGQEFGAWSRFTNHPAVGWANLADDAYWASTAGDVFLVRNRGEASDYRDEAAPVAQAVIELRPEDFDLPGIRKVVANVTAEVELETTDLTGLAVEIAMSLSRTFEAAGSVAVTADDFQQRTFRAALPTRRGTHVQVRYTHQVKDEVLHLTGVAYHVAQLTPKLIPQTNDA